MPVPLHLGLIPVHTTFHLAGERQEMLVNELGGKTVTRVLLGGLDVLVDKLLRLEPLIAALIRAGEWPQTRVIHQVKLETSVSCISCGTSSVGAGELRRISRMLRVDVTLEVTSLCKSCPTLLAKVRSQSQVDCISVQLKIGLVREGQPTRGALERLLLEVDTVPMTLQVSLLRERLVAVTTFEHLLPKVN